MSASTDPIALLREARPALDPESYVFVCLAAKYGDHAEYEPIASFAETEGLTLVVRREIADAHDLRYDGIFNRITLQAYSSLEAVGLTAAFSGRLAAAGIAANVVAAFHHDHIFVPAADADRAMSALAMRAEQQ